MITGSQHGLDFGALDLIGYDTTGSYYYETIADGTDWGNAEQTVRAIESFLMDGAIQVVDGYGNREMVLEIKIVGEDSYGLALGEQALFLEVAKQRNTLTWTPPNIITGSGTPCVFDVVTSRLDHNLDDMGELRLERRYKLTITALSWARSQTLVSVTSPAPPSTSPVVTSIDACTSTTGWAGSPNAAATSGGAVTTSVTNTTGGPTTLTTSLNRTGLSVTGMTGQYVRVERTSPLFLPSSTKINGIAVTPAAQSGMVAWYLSPVATITSIQISNSAYVPAGATSLLAIADLSKTNIAQDQAGARQVARSFDVAGSARAQGNLTLADPSTSLGSVLVFTTPAGDAAAQPPLRTSRTAGSTETTDTTVVSGKTSDLSTLHTFDIPAANIPAGAYQLMVRVKHASAGSYAITYAGKSRMGSTNIDTGQTGTLTKTLTAGAWTIVPLEVLQLPTYNLGDSGLVRIELSGPSGLLLDEAWLFNVDVGQLTWAECGTGTPAAGGAASKLFLDAASLANPSNSVWLGTATDRSDAYGAGYPALQAMGRHECIPQSMNVFVVTTNSVATAVTLSYYPSFHSHVL